MLDGGRLTAAPSWAEGAVVHVRATPGLRRSTYDYQQTALMRDVVMNDHPAPTARHRAVREQPPCWLNDGAMRTDRHAELLLPAVPRVRGCAGVRVCALSHHKARACSSAREGSHHERRNRSPSTTSPADAPRAGPHSRGARRTEPTHCSVWVCPEHGRARRGGQYFDRQFKVVTASSQHGFSPAMTTKPESSAPSGRQPTKA